MNMHYFVPDNMDNCLSYSVVSYLKKLKNQAKLEYDKMVALVGIKSSHVTAVPVRFRCVWQHSCLCSVDVEYSESPVSADRSVFV